MKDFEGSAGAFPAPTAHTPEAEPDCVLRLKATWVNA